MKTQEIDKKLIKGSETTKHTTFAPEGHSSSLSRHEETANLNDFRQSSNNKDLQEAANLWVGICIEQIKAKKN